MADDAPPSVTLARSVAGVANAVAGVLSIVVFLLLARATLASLAGGTVIAGLGTFAFALLFLAIGVLLTPPVRRRVDRAHHVAQFGWTRAIDHRVLRPEDEPSERCVACDDRLDAGLVRRYREEFVVAGLPLYTRSEGHNHYCVECAHEEVFGTPADQTDAASDTDAVDDLDAALGASGDEPTAERDDRAFDRE